MAARCTGGERVADGVRRCLLCAPGALSKCQQQAGPVLDETFAPILYVMKYTDFDEALEMHNDVAAGPVVLDLHQRSCARPKRSCRPAVRIAALPMSISAPSGAEIGGAFGGEKETGGGRESGFDAWKAYMRRATNTVNYGRPCRSPRASSSTSIDRHGHLQTIEGRTCSGAAFVVQAIRVARDRSHLMS